METSSQQRMVVIILTAVLLAAIAVGAVMYFIPNLNNPKTPVTQGEGPAQRSSSGSEVGFNTAVLSQPDYVALDASLFSRGLLPVQPPAGAGKQNPFQ